MAYSAAAIVALTAQCAPNVAPQTVVAIIRTESRGNPLALNVNGGLQPLPQRSAADAAAIGRRYVAAGYSVDLGLGQINSRNMRRLGLTWDTVFDPCTNIAALGRVLTENYETALVGREPQAALRIAFSLYNTGSPSRGFRNGYVGRVVGNAGASDQPDPNTEVVKTKFDDGRLTIVAENTGLATSFPAREATPPAWNIFARAAHTRRAVLPSTTIRSRSVWSD